MNEDVEQTPDDPRSHGGKKLLANRGVEFFREIGKLGGGNRRRAMEDAGLDPLAEFRALGLKGGSTTKERHGSAHFSAIGRKGGLKSKRGKASG